MNPDAVLSTPIAVTIVVVFSVLWVALGWWLGRANRSLEDYMLAGRHVGMGLATATAMATWVTANTTMTAPQLAYQLGIWGMVGYSLGAVGLLLFAPMAKRIREMIPNGYTSGDFIRVRYGKFAWRVFLLISLFYALGWLVSLAMAGGILVESLSGIPYAWGMTVIVVTCTLYTVFGGLRAVIGTDFVQTVIILVGLALLAGLVITEVGFEPMHQRLAEERPGLLNLLLPASLMFLFNNLFFGVGEIFHSNVWWSRAFAFGEGVGFRAYLLAGLMWLPVPIVAGFIALAAPVLGVNVPSPDMVAPLVAAHLMGEVGAIVVFIVVFAALASSLDSLLAATSDLLLNDIYRGHLRPAATDVELRRAAAWIIVALGALAWALAMPRVNTLAALLYLTGAFVASTIWPIVFGLRWRRGSGAGASAAMILGTACGLIAYNVIGFYVAALVSAAVSLLVTAVTFWFSRQRFAFRELAATRAAGP
ncbi:urea transporter [Marinihelvus fidelis]|uniref:Urea transporter n=1 Tax=Marinihelvus fidelis TaxID=2613842 RepID=A0A5N0TJ01_9GAMM|nr:sodium:solute symporter family protein [Marinihelvus fidelis]KAA9133269.1 urea transporter [Marinihelvus fidelis]